MSDHPDLAARVEAADAALAAAREHLANVQRQRQSVPL